MAEINTEHLREIADAAFRATGEWRLRAAKENHWFPGAVGLYGKYGFVIRPSSAGGMFNDDDAAQHVVTFDPPMVLALLDRLATAEAKLHAEATA